MSHRPGILWQERVLRRQKVLTVRAKLVWTLTVLVLLSLVPVAGSLFTIDRTRNDISGILRTAIDPSLLVDDVQLALAQSRLARVDFLFTADTTRGEDATEAAGFVRILIESGKGLWPYAPNQIDQLSSLARRYEQSTRDLVARPPARNPRLRVTSPEQAEEARTRFLSLRTEALRTPPGPQRERVLRQAREALLDLDDAVTYSLGSGWEADSLLGEVNDTENRLEDLSHDIYNRATTKLTSERMRVVTDLSLSVRDLLVIIVISLTLALAAAVTAPQWILRPIRRLTMLVHYARTGAPQETRIPVSDDEVGRLATFLEEHLRRDREVEEVRRGLHRAAVQRVEALVEATGMHAAGVGPGNLAAFIGRRLREALGLGGATSMAIPFEQVWPDPALLSAIRTLRRSKESEASVELTTAPFAGRTASLIRTRTGDPANAEIIVLVPRGEPSAPENGGESGGKRS